MRNHSFFLLSLVIGLSYVHKNQLNHQITTGLKKIPNYFLKRGVSNWYFKETKNGTMPLTGTSGIGKKTVKGAVLNTNSVGSCNDQAMHKNEAVVLANFGNKNYSKAMFNNLYSVESCNDHGTENEARVSNQTYNYSKPGKFNLYSVESYYDHVMKNTEAVVLTGGISKIRKKFSKGGTCNSYKESCNDEDNEDEWDNEVHCPIQHSAF